MSRLTQNLTALRRILLFPLLFFSFHGESQTYPVQAFVQLNPPYSSYLPDYSDPFNNQMKVLLTLTDFTVPSYQVKMRLSFEGSGYSIKTADLLPLPIITLSPGVPVEISGSDLSPYLMSSNLIFTGIDPVDYELRKVLPEGPVTVCAEIIDYSGPNQSVLSNNSCTQAWFSLFDPPLLNLPFCGTQITPTDPQNVLFSWTPLHMSSPYSIAGTEYTFELYELRPDDADPNQVVNSSLPIYMEVTTLTFLNYGIIQPQLQLGLSYVWRVKVREVTGRDVFRNQGYSAVCVFTYGSIAESLAEGIVLELNAEGTGVRQGLAWWNGSGVFTGYELEVRKTGNSSYLWFPYSSEQYSLKVNDLEPSTEYECRVKGISGDYESEWSNTSYFTTQPKPVYACGSTAQPPTVPDIIPLQNALPGMTFTIGQFDMTVSSITGAGPPGHFTGFGRVNIPFILLNLKVKFDDILVDENHFIRGGSVVALSKGLDEWIDDQFTPFQIPGEIDDFEFHGDSSVTVYFGDESITYDFPEDGGPLYFEDETGLTYTVYSDGTVEVSGNITLSDDQLFATQDYQVVFSTYQEQEFGFDALQFLEWQGDYEAILLLDSTYYFTPYKSISSGGNDEVIATVISEDGMPGLRFETLTGREIPHVSVGDNSYKLNLSGFTESAYVYAFDDSLKVGKLWIKVLPTLEKKVVIIPVNGADISSQDVIQTELNEIYKQANVIWDLSIASNFSNSSWDLSSDSKLQSADATIMSKYSDEMRSLRDAYFEANSDYDKAAFHVFVVPAFDDSGLKGYMVRGRGLGFIQSGENGKTIGHELGHGAFDLQHTFPQLDLGSSNNLMDYVDSVHLRQRQWYEIHNNFPVFSFLDGEEDGSAAIVSNIEDLDPFRNHEGKLCFLSVGGAPITLDAAVQKVVLSTSEDQWKESRQHLPIGALTAFQIDGIWYSGIKGKGSGNFYGYRNQDDPSDLYVDSSSHSYNFTEITDPKFTEVLTGTPCLTKDGFVYKVFPTSKFTDMMVPLDVAENNEGAGPHFGLTDFSNFFSREDEAVQVRAMFTSELSEAQLGMFQQLSGLGEICGADAVWAYSASHLFHDNPEELPCISALIEGAEDYEDAMNTVTATYIDDLHPTDQPIVIRPAVEDFPYKEYQLNHEEEVGENFYEYFYKAMVALINQIKPLQEAPELLEGLPLHFVANILLTFEPYQRQCLLKTLPYKTRVDLLKSYTDWGSLSTSKESLLVDLVGTTPIDEGKKLLDELRANNNQLFWGLYDDINGSNSDAFLAYVSILALETLEQDSFLDEWPEELDTETRFLPIWKNDLPEKAIGAERSGDKVLIAMSYSFGDETNVYGYLGDPFEFVRLKFKDDYQFQNITTGERIEKDEELIVPAAWAYWIIDRQETIENWEVVRIVANIGAAAIAIATMEPGPLLAVELLANGSDITLAVFEDEIMSSGSEEAQLLYKEFEVFVALLDITMVSITIKGAYKSYKLAPSKFQKIIDEKLDSPSSFDELIDGLKSVVLANRKTKAEDFSSGNVILSATVENLFKELKVNRHGRFAKEAEAPKIFVDQDADLFFKTSPTNSFGIAKVMEDGIDGVYLKELRWADEFYNEAVDGALDQVLHYFDNIHYQKADGSTVKGNLEVVQATKSGAIFVRKVDPVATTLKTKPTWKSERIITGNVDNETGIIGCFDKTMPNGIKIDDLKQVLDELGYPEAYVSHFLETSVGGFRMLNVNQYYFTAPDIFWDKFNKAWLDYLVAKKADIVVMSNPTDELLKYQWDLEITTQTAIFKTNKETGEKIKTIFGREIDYMDDLVEKGIYKWDEVKGAYVYSVD
ncbi:fibronectin type III domain-containing protein [Crocinitomix catalasitica]|nr:fibronectin type III domain-containing protein [Crocinitomix catalasitica]